MMTRDGSTFTSSRTLATLLFASLFTLGLGGLGCGEDPGNSPTDLGVTDSGPVQPLNCDGSAGPRADLSAKPTGKLIEPGDIGSACTVDSECTEGSGTRVCFKTNLLNNPSGAATPGGYCSATCNGDSDCGAGNACVDFGAGSGKYCTAGCNDAVTCRKPSYQCNLLGSVNVCLPKLKQYSCNPTLDGPCKTITSVPTGRDGACVRQTIEDEDGGICYPLCQAGGPACGSDTLGQELACLFYDYTRSGDAFRGTLCLPAPATPTVRKDQGAACNFLDECKTGLQCDSEFTGPNPSRICLQLCDLNKPVCSGGGSCQNAFGTCNGAGLCR